MAKKIKNEVDKLRNELYELKENGMLDNLSEQGFENVSRSISSRLNVVF